MHYRISNLTLTSNEYTTVLLVLAWLLARLTRLFNHYDKCIGRAQKLSLHMSIGQARCCGRPTCTPIHLSVQYSNHCLESHISPTQSINNISISEFQHWFWHLLQCQATSLQFSIDFTHCRSVTVPLVSLSRFN